MKRWEIAATAICTVAAIVVLWLAPPSLRGFGGVLLVVAGAQAAGLLGGVFAAAFAGGLLALASALERGTSWSTVAADVAMYLIVAAAVGHRFDFGRRRPATQASAPALREQERERAADGEARYRALFEACDDAILVCALDDQGLPGLMVDVNESACMSLGYARHELLTMSIFDVVAPESHHVLFQQAESLRLSGRALIPAVYQSRDGRRMPVEVSSRLIESEGQTRSLTIAHDVAARQELEELLRTASHRDELTGLYSRRGFFMMVEHERRRARRLGAPAMLVYADLDGLQAVNDRLGHGAGDALLLAVADALRTTFRDSDVLARLGGDEFVALAVFGRDDEERLSRDLVASRLDDALAAKSTELGDQLALSLSYCALLVDWAELGQIDGLLTRADACVRDVKQAKQGEQAKRAEQAEQAKQARDERALATAPLR
jgi:diguanylate cyclase (GGDEF)-like protein/PAS domain S-box-containing protein